MFKCYKYSLRDDICTKVLQIFTAGCNVLSIIAQRDFRLNAILQARVTLSDFDSISILGHGGFGKVCCRCVLVVAVCFLVKSYPRLMILSRALQVLQVQLKGSSKMFAMKVL